LPTSVLRLFKLYDEVASHALINSDDGSHALVRFQGERWLVAKVKDVSKQGGHWVSNMQR
jgi:hypothetical protein